MLTTSELLRNILVVLLLISLLSWLLSLVKVTFAVRTIRREKKAVLENLLAILANHQFKIKEKDPARGRIVTEGLVNVIDLLAYGLIGNRVVFQLTELTGQEVQLRVYGKASFPFIRAGIRKSEQATLIDEKRINRVIDELMKG